MSPVPSPTTVGEETRCPPGLLAPLQVPAKAPTRLLTQSGYNNLYVGTAGRQRGACWMRRLMTIMAFAGGLLGLGNYVWDGWTTASGGRNLYVPSNIVSVLLLVIAGSVAATMLLREHGRPQHRCVARREPSGIAYACGDHHRDGHLQVVHRDARFTRTGCPGIS